MTEHARLKMLKGMAMAERVARAHATAVSESQAGIVGVRRVYPRLPGSREFHGATPAGQWTASIPEDAPIWKAARRDTCVWKVVEEAGHER